jgi:hypothetical protein
MSAFAMCSLKAPSLLAFDKGWAEGNLHTIFKVCKALGHVDIKSTMAYMDDFSEEIRRAQLA